MFPRSHCNSLLKLLVCLSVFTLAVHAQTNRNDPNAGAGGNRGAHVIRGKIFMPSGRLPEQRIRVVLEVISGGMYSDTFSDSVGNFEFRSLPNNNYRVVVPSDGFIYEPAQEQLEVSGSVSRTFTVQIYLREKARDNSLNSSNKMISAAEFAQDVPKAAKKIYEQGLKKMKDGKDEDASMLFQEALKIFPDYVLAHNKLGEYYLRQQKPTEARTEFERALEISPKLPLTHLNLGMLMVSQKLYPEAIKHLEAANKLDESFPMAHLYLGLALLEKTPQEPSDSDHAERAFTKAIALGGTQMAYAHKYLFNIQVRRKNYDKAVSELEAYLTETPNAPDAEQIRAKIGQLKKVAGSTSQAAKPK